MKRILPLSCILIILSGGCISYQATEPTLATPAPDLAGTVAAGISATQTAAADDFQPALTYSTLELAELLIPGDFLEGAWTPSSVLDLTQPYPGLPDWCGEYYGGCWKQWPSPADYGVELSLVNQGESLGEVVFLYYHDQQALEKIMELYQENWANIEKTEAEPDNDIWLQFIDNYETLGLGDQSSNKVGYSLYDPDDRELLIVQLAFVRCHGFAHIELRIPPDTNYRDDNKETRLQEQEANFQLVYDYAQNLDLRLTPYACSD